MIRYQNVDPVSAQGTQNAGIFSRAASHTNGAARSAYLLQTHRDDTVYRFVPAKGKAQWHRSQPVLLSHGQIIELPTGQLHLPPKHSARLQWRAPLTLEDKPPRHEPFVPYARSGVWHGHRQAWIDKGFDMIIAHHGHTSRQFTRLKMGGEVRAHWWQTDWEILFAALLRNGITMEWWSKSVGERRLMEGGLLEGCAGNFVKRVLLTGWWGRI